MRGLFVVLEGPDGSGTTTHSHLLAADLQSKGFDIVLTNEPTDGRIGTWIREMLRSGAPMPQDALQLLFCADRAEHVKTVIEPALSSGKIVLSDRYAASTLAYGEALGVDAGWLSRVNDAFPKPDVELFLLPPVDVCAERISTRKAQDSFEKRELQEKIHASYRRLASAQSSIQVIDSSGSVDDVASLIAATVTKRLS